VLLARAPSNSVLGIYGKGSAFKRWASPVDYVPELSDVDLHVRFASQDAAEQTLGTVDSALDVAGEAAALFAARFPDAVHTPRPQLILLHEMERQPGYLPAPHETVRPLHGADYPRTTADDYARERDGDARRFLADAAFLDDEAPGQLMDRPGRFAWQVVSRLMWRMGPAGARLLTWLGHEPRAAWSLHRTAIVRELERRTGQGIATAYVDFYRAGWQGFRTGFQDGDSAIQAVRAALAFFRAGRALLAHADPRAHADRGAPSS